MSIGYGIFPRITFKPAINRTTTILTGIEINPRSPMYTAQLAKARYEFYTQWKVLIASTLIMAFLFLLVYPLSIVFSVIPAAILFMTKQYRRDLEEVSREIEAVTAAKYYGYNINDFENQTAIILNMFNPLWKDIPVEQIRSRMRRRYASAFKWVQAHNQLIQKDLRKQIL